MSYKRDSKDDHHDKSFNHIKNIKIFKNNSSNTNTVPTSS